MELSSEVFAPRNSWTLSYEGSIFRPSILMIQSLYFFSIHFMSVTLTLSLYIRTRRNIIIVKGGGNIDRHLSWMQNEEYKIIERVKKREGELKKDLKIQIKGNNMPYTYGNVNCRNELTDDDQVILEVAGRGVPVIDSTSVVTRVASAHIGDL